MFELHDVRFEIDEMLAKYEVVLAALTRFRAGILGAQAGFSLPEGTEQSHLEKAVRELEGTYLIRM